MREIMHFIHSIESVYRSMLVTADTCLLSALDKLQTQSTFTGLFLSALCAIRSRGNDTSQGTFGCTGERKQEEILHLCSFTFQRGLDTCLFK